MSLRERILAGAVVMISRRLVGIALQVVGLTLLVRMLGAGEYGLYAGSAAIVAFLSVVARFGIDVFLIRGEHELPIEVEYQASTLLAASGAAAAALLVAFVSLAPAALPAAGFRGPLLALAAVLPFELAWLTPRARLERRLHFGFIAATELAADVAFYAIALPIAWLTSSAWAPVAGYVARHLLFVGAYSWRAGYLPRARWSSGHGRAMLTYGAGYSTAQWLHQSRTLINPFVVGHFAGVEAVGLVALATNLVRHLSIARIATSRLGIIAFSRVSETDPARLRAAHADGMVLQVLASGTLLAAAVSASPLLLPLLVPEQWRVVAMVFSLCALRGLGQAMFRLHTSILQARGSHRAVVATRGVQAILFALAAVVLVPPLGPVGFGVAQLAQTVGFWVLDRAIRPIFHPRYDVVLPWLAAYVPLLATPWVPARAAPLLLVPALMLVCSPRQREQLRGYARSFLRAMRTPPTGDSSEAARNAVESGA